MRTQKILLVANRTAAESNVVAVLRDRASRAPIEVTLLVPTTPSRTGLTWDETTCRSDARQRMNAAVANLRRLGISATPVLGDFSPLEAIRDEMRRCSYDEIVISTLPTRTSRWLRMDLPTRVGREFAVPVTLVQAQSDPDWLAPAGNRRAVA